MKVLKEQRPIFASSLRLIWMRDWDTIGSGVESILRGSIAVVVCEVDQLGISNRTFLQCEHTVVSVQLAVLTGVWCWVSLRSS